MQPYTDVEEYWMNNDEYHARQGEAGSVKANKAFFRKVFKFTNNLESILELGAGEGRNIEALLGHKNLYAVELNNTAASKITCQTYVGSIYDNPFQADLVFTKGLLIHIPPEDIKRAYDVIYKASKKYILICEYYSPRREMIPYRGEDNRLWKANFHKEITERFPDLKLLDYGFVGHWDEYPQDDITWWLFRK